MHTSLWETQWLLHTSTGSETRVFLGPLQVALGIAQNRETRICLWKTDVWRHQAAKHGTCSTEPHLNHAFPPHTHTRTKSLQCFTIYPFKMILDPHNCCTFEQLSQVVWPIECSFMSTGTDLVCVNTTFIVNRPHTLNSTQLGLRFTCCAMPKWASP